MCFFLLFPAGIYLLKFNNRNTRTRCEICSELTIKTPERRQWRIYPYLSVFSPNAGKYRPEKLRIWTIFCSFVPIKNPYQVNVFFLYPLEITGKFEIFEKYLKISGNISFKRVKCIIIQKINKNVLPEWLHSH